MSGSLFDNNATVNAFRGPSGIDISQKYQDYAKSQADTQNAIANNALIQAQTSNAISNNALIQANTANTNQDTTNKTTTNTGMLLDQHLKRWTAQSQKAMALAADPDNTSQTPDAYKAIIANGLQTGEVTPTEAVQYNQQIDAANGDPNKLRSLAIQHGQSVLSAHDQMQNAQGDITWQTANDGTRYAVRAPSANQQLQNPNSQPTTNGRPFTQINSTPAPQIVETTDDRTTIPDANGNPIANPNYGKPMKNIVGGTPTGTGQPAAPPAAAPAMVDALRGTEGTPNGQTSVQGARGQLQITPAFFKTYAQPGESFDSKADVETVGQRGIAAINAKYPNDPQRAAVEYFSGPGNVAPAGSPTPWKTDAKDANGATTSGYVNRFMNRYKPPAQTAAQGSAPASAAQPTVQPTAQPAGGIPITPIGASGLAPGQSEALASQQKSGQQMADGVIASDLQRPQRQALLSDIETQSRVPGAFTGPNATGWTKIKSTLGQIPGFTSDDTKTGVAAQEQLAKDMANYQTLQLNRMGGLGTNQGLQQTIAGAPHPEMSQTGTTEVVHHLQGNEDAEDVMSRAWKQSPNYATNPGSFPVWRDQFTNKVQSGPDAGAQFDPRVFWLGRMKSATERKTFYDATPDKDQLDKNYSYAVSQGWIPHPQQAGK